MNNQEDDNEKQLIDAYQKIANESEQMYRVAYMSKFKNKNEDEIAKTVICSFALHNKNNKSFTFVSLGIGTKSLPESIAIQHAGKVIKDMHAEILARRGLIKYFIQTIPKAQQENQLFEWNHKRKKHALRKQYEVIMYVNQVFCGDCMIDEDSNLFSGARPLKYFDLKQMPQQKFVRHCLRTKPGRLDLPVQKRTLSLSCSDKIMTWNILGVQGKRLFNYIEPIYINTIIMKTNRIIKKQNIQNGIDLVDRINKLYDLNSEIIQKKLFKIVVEEKQRYITNQFKENKPKIVILLSKQIQKKNEEVKAAQKILDLCGIINHNRQIFWINGRTGLPEGMNINRYNKLSSFCSQQLYSNLKSQQSQQFKYHAVKSRIKMLFKEWTDNFRKIAS